MITLLLTYSVAVTVSLLVSLYYFREVTIKLRESMNARGRLEKSLNEWHEVVGKNPRGIKSNMPVVDPDAVADRVFDRETLAKILQLPNYHTGGIVPKEMRVKSGNKLDRVLEIMDGNESGMNKEKLRESRETYHFAMAVSAAIKEGRELPNVKEWEEEYRRKEEDV